ncbi:MAG: DUF448 domain-containing protein [Desulfuromonadaceae bacterium]|nr:DUF448 domain-containing protein [Desulfuromonadaceae bacterium]MDD2855146.1 DUF448 domain-containing protein [Desulfuromonadaceae bacterium]
MTHKGIADIPQRTCLGCRVSKDKQQLLRFIQTPEMEIYPDLDNKLPGRGAYTCNSIHCVATAVDRQQFKRSFKQNVTVMQSDVLIDYLRKQLSLRIIGLIGLANKAGLITAGSSLVTDMLKGRNKPGLIIIAADISEAIGSKIITCADYNKVPRRMVLTKDDLGAVLGKAPKSAISIASSGFVAQLIKAIDRYRNFLGEV